MLNVWSVLVDTRVSSLSSWCWEGHGRARVALAVAAASHLLAKQMATKMTAGFRDLFEAFSDDDNAAKGRALTKLSCNLDLADNGPQKDMLCEMLRSSGSLEKIFELATESSPEVHQPALMLVSAATSSETDRCHEESRQLLLRDGRFRQMVKHIFSENVLTILQTCGIVKNMCHEISLVAVLYDLGCVPRLRQLARGDGETAEVAKDCLKILMDAVNRSSSSARVTKAAIKLQSAARKQIVMQSEGALIVERRLALLGLQSKARGAAARRVRRQLHEEKVARNELAGALTVQRLIRRWIAVRRLRLLKQQQEEEKGALIMQTAMRRLGAVRTFARRLKEQVAESRAAEKAAIESRLAEVEAARTTKEETEAAARAMQEAKRQANVARKEEERQSRKKAILAEKQAKAQARQQEREAKEEAEEVARRELEVLTLKREENLRKLGKLSASGASRDTCGS
jgi:hypothetical protein